MVNIYNLYKVYVRIGNPLTICGWRQGKAIKIYSNGKLRFICNYINDTFHGLLQWSFSNGQLDYEAHYHYGALHGYVREWYYNGKLMYEYYYQYGFVKYKM